MMEKKICIVLLNWNAYKDTIECIKSFLNLKHKNYQLIIIDNASEDRSIYYISKFLKKNKLSFVIYSEKDIFENNYNENYCNTSSVIIANSKNYGFAKGINIALKFLLKINDFDFIWLVNNDSIVDKEALSNLIKIAEKDKRIGFVGSVIRYYDKPDYIQAVGGGKFYPFLGIGKLYMKNKHISIIKELDPEKVNNYLDYIMGASLLIRKEVLQEVGLFDEDYFLYTEELDLITRAKKKGWKLAVALDSFIYHKDSASTKNKKWLYYYYLNKSNMIYVKKHYGFPYTITAAIFLMLNTIRLTRNWKNIKGGFKGVWDGFKS